MSEGLFISYRRSDSQGSTGRLADHLRQNGFGGEGDMFLDIDSRIPPGVDFRVVINETLAGCDLVIVVMGRHWLDASDSKGRRRLDRTSDTHRLEVAAALNSAARVIPVLVEGASHPSEEDLPDDLKELAFLQSWSLGERNYAGDVETLSRRMLDARRQMEAERERVAAEKELERLAAEAATAENERQDRERVEATAAEEAERGQAAAAEKERQGRQRAEAAAAEEVEREQAAAAEKERERLEVATTEQERVAAEKAEQGQAAAEDGDRQERGARTPNQIETLPGGEAHKTGLSPRTQPDHVNTMLPIAEIVLTWVISGFIGAMLVSGLISIWYRSTSEPVESVVIVLGIAAVPYLGLWAVSRFRRTQPDYINTMLRITEIALKWVMPGLIAFFLAWVLVTGTGGVQSQEWFEGAWKLGIPGALAFWGGWVVGRYRRRRQQETASAR